jgi:hypothetical protein
MGAVANVSSGDVEKDRTGASRAGAAATPQIRGGRTVTYQLILRHLAKFRDGATALLDLFAIHAPAADGTRRRLSIREPPLRQSPNRPKRSLNLPWSSASSATCPGSMSRSARSAT